MGSERTRNLVEYGSFRAMSSRLVAARQGLAPGDPDLPDWEGMVLPDTWADHLRWWQLGGVFALFRVLLLSRRRPVEVPEGVPLAAELPDYIKQEFHAIPNGNYSNRLVAPYVEGFDLSMLGRIQAVRRWVAERFEGLGSVLDVGCGGGKLAGEIQRAGVPDVWGIDASPYMLKYAASLNPGVKFVQGLAERMAFADERFDAACACFLFHELPPSAADQVVTEIWRVLKPHAPLIIIEPGPEQLSTKNPFKLWKLAGLAGLYFGVLARRVYEPFVEQWHGRNHREWLTQHGFRVLEERSAFPFRIHVALRHERRAFLPGQTSSPASS